MSNEALLALFTMTGIFISAIVSFLISRSMTSTEKRKLHVDIQKSYEIKLLEARLSSYPILYEVLSDFIKDVECKAITKTELEKLLDRTNKWDSKYAIFFSDQSAETCYNYRQNLKRSIRDAGEESEEKPLPSETVNYLKEQTANLEHCLKTDLAIYGIQESDSGYGLRVTNKFKEYKDGRLMIGQPSPRNPRLTSGSS